MGLKFKPEIEGEDGWSRWVSPKLESYKLACCECGLVHDMQFQIVRRTKIQKNGYFTPAPTRAQLAVLFRARRNERMTKTLRANNAKKK